MSERVRKVESVVRQAVAMALVQYVPDAARATVTSVDVAPDLRTAIVWIGIIGDDPARQTVFASVEGAKSQLQAAVAAQLTTKFVPKLTLKLDTSGEYAEDISRLIDQL